MSVPTLWLTCARCGESFNDGVLHGYFEYELPDGAHIPLERRSAWCNGCDAMVAMENLDSAAAEERRGRLVNQMADNGGFLVWLPWKRSAMAYLREELKGVDQQLDYLRQRTTAPKCLSCGSDQVTPLPPSPHPEQDGPAIPAGWKHPGCGGEVQASLSGLRFIYVYPLRIYDADGSFLRESEYDER